SPRRESLQKRGERGKRGNLSSASNMKIYIGQINPTVGALRTNAELIRLAYDDGVRVGADVVLVPELSVVGYPPRDLLDRQIFVQAATEVKESLVAMTGDVA